ncbi:MAG TPA: hypothetical protein VGR73_06225 [Bryobacteraceae bacterium]|nr:hypothetical protein [Bryobacteraceae bacterium]
MAFCSNCGAEVQGRFCAKCGSPVAAGPAASAPPPPSPPPSPQQSYTPPPPQQGYVPPPPGYQQPGYTAPPPGATVQAGGMTDNLAAALCYVLGLLTGILFLVLAPYNQNRLIRFHAFQSIFVHLALFATMIALAVLTGILRIIPFIGVMLSFVLYPIAGLCFFVLWLALMYKAYNGERWVLPVVGPLAEKQA